MPKSEEELLTFVNDKGVDMTTEKPFNRNQHFKSVVSEHNKKTGFSFTLDELNKDEAYKYAHATHTGETYTITCQMDTESDFMYALCLKFEDSGISLSLDNGLTKDSLDKTMQSEAFKTRLGAIKVMEDLQRQLNSEIDQLTSNIMSDSLAESAKQDAYDTIMLVSRKLLRP